MENNLFRKKSLDHISSPEEMHDYMRVTSPKVWMILGAILLLLAGFIIFFATARMESSIHLKAECSYGSAFSYIPTSQMDVVKIHMPVRIDGHPGKISDMSISTMYKFSITMDSGELLEDGYPEFSFEPVEGLPESLTYHDSLIVQNGLAIQFVGSSDLETLRSRDWRIRVNGNLGTLTNVEPIDMSTLFFEMDDKDLVFPDGTVDVQIVTESTTPISFLIN